MQTKLKNKQKKINFQVFKKEYLKEILYVIVFLSFIGSMILYVIHSDNTILKSGISTVGKISHVGGKNVHVTYTINKNTYETVVGNTPQSIENEELYYIKVSPLDYKQIVIEYWNPYIDKKIYQKTHAYKTNWSFLNRINRTIEFSYKIDNTIYTRYQKIPPSFDIDKLHHYKIFNVIYNKNSYEIAYLIL